MTPLLEPLQADLLRAAFLHSDEALPAWRRWRDSVDWDSHLDPYAFALLPAVYRNLQRLGVDDPLFPRFKGIVRQSWLHNQQRIAALNDTLTSCSRSQVEVLMLPPTSLWLTDTTAVLSPAQPHNWAVAPAHAERAIRCLHETGWRSRQVRLPSALLPGYVRGARHLFLENGDERLVLTWGLEFWFENRAREVWDRSRKAELGTHAVRALDPTDALEFVLRQPVAETWLRRMADVLTIHAAAERIEWVRLHSELLSCPLPASWSEALRFMRPFLVEGSGTAVDLHRCCGERPLSTMNGTVGGTWLARARRDWAAYLCSWGDDTRASTALVQLPGYMMGRWHLAGPSQLPRGVYRWMRYHTRTR